MRRSVRADAAQYWPRLADLQRTLGDFVALTKPAIVSLLVVTAVAGAFLAAQGVPPAAALTAIVLGGSLAAGGAGALNHYMERDLDGAMARTRRRPLPGHRIPPLQALAFGVALNLLALLVFLALANPLAAGLAMLGSVFYLVVYTRWLKRTTSQNIVIGGAAGAIPPLVGWAAVTGGLGLPALYLFAIVFFWTPPHFWALALILKDDYARAGIPMLPVVQGDRATARQIFLYTLLVIALTVLLFTTGTVGWLYLAVAVVSGAALLLYSWQLLRHLGPRQARRLYMFSLIYLAAVFAAVMIDSSVLG